MNRIVTTSFGITLAVAITCAALFAQQPTPLAPARNAEDFHAIDDYGVARNWQWYQAGDGRPHLADLARSYVKAQNDDAKAMIRKKLTEALGEQFDQHGKKQEKELRDIEKQIANLKDLLRRRLEAKTAIVERRADQLIHDADGMGWTSPSSPNLYSAPSPYWTSIPSETTKPPASTSPLAK
jgi:hypothetical protein